MTQELKIGIVVATAIIIAGIMITLAGGRSIYKPGYTIKVYFDYVSGLDIGAPVRLAGMEIGEVRRLQLVNDKIQVTIWVEASAKIRSDSRITINSLGIIGEKYIEITLGQKGRYLKNGDTIVGINPVNVDELLERSEKVVYMLDRQVRFLEALLFKGEETWVELAKTINNMSEITQRINKLIKHHESDIIDSLHNIKEFTYAVKTISRDNRMNIQRIVQEVRKTTANMNKAVIHLDKEIDKCGKEFIKSTEAISRLCKAIQEGNGMLSRIINDKQIAENIAEATKNLRELSEELKNKPWKLFRKK
jgi:phospholipid/cholesterol/gamma-HCH transport system substrate-binding protein